jgi:DNA-binding MarR family transcriptional regulator
MSEDGKRDYKDARLRIYQYLKEHEGQNRQVDIAQSLNISQAAVSRHLRSLSRAGLIRISKFVFGEARSITITKPPPIPPPPPSIPLLPRRRPKNPNRQ